MSKQGNEAHCTSFQCFHLCVVYFVRPVCNSLIGVYVLHAGKWWLRHHGEVPAMVWTAMPCSDLPAYGSSRSVLATGRPSRGITGATSFSLCLDMATKLLLFWELWEAGPIHDPFSDCVVPAWPLADWPPRCQQRGEWGTGLPQYD